MARIAAPLQLPTGFGPVLAIPAFRALWAGQIASQLAVNSMLFVLALRVYEATGSNTAVSGLFLAYGIPAVLFGLIAGAVVDRLNKRTVLILCDLMRVVFLLGLLFFSGSIIFIYVLTFLNALVTQFYLPSEAPTIPRIVPSHAILAANSLFSFTFYSSLAVGSVLAGPMVRLFGSQWVFLVIAILFAIGAWANAQLPRTLDPDARPLRSVLTHNIMDIIMRIVLGVREGVSYIKSSPVLSDALLLLAGTQVMLAVLGTLGPGFADRVLEIDVRDASLIIVGPVVVGIIAGALWVGSFGENIAHKKLITTGIIGAGAILMIASVWVRLARVEALAGLYASDFTLPFIVVLFFLFGVANSLLDVPANSILQESAQGSMRGRVYGMLTAAVGGGGLIPVVLGGVLADTIGVGKVILALGLIVSLYGVFRLRYNR